MKRALAVLSVLLVSACGGIRPPKPPGPRPTPTPSPTPSPATSTPLLHATGKVFTDAKGAPVFVRFHESCCFSEDGEPDPAWAFATKEHLDHIKALGFNGTHWRLGPATPRPDWPASLQAVGGGYLQVDGLKVDLNKWNPKFFPWLRDLALYAKSIGIYVEIDLIDGWACKKDPGWWERENPGQMPWLPVNNVQGFDAFSQCGKVQIAPGTTPQSAVYEAWLRKIVETLGDLDNIVYQDGNEILLVDGYSPAWTASIGNVVRDEEARRGFAHHLFGTNAAATSAGLPQVDYVTVHTQNPIQRMDCNTETKPCRNNEYNPNPPHSPEQLKMLACDAEAKGYYWDYWRGGQSKAQFEETARLLREKCQGQVSGCSNIPDVGAVQVLPRPATFKYTAEVNAALQELWPSGQVPVQQKVGLLQLAQKLREKGLCAGVQTDNHGLVDQVCVGTEQECQGCHALNCKAVACPDDNPDCGCDGGNVSTKPGPQCYNGSDTWRRP